MGWPAFDWDLFVQVVLRLVGSVLLTIPVAWEREHSTGTAGLRTFSIVAIASCGYVLVAMAVVGDDPVSQARILQGLMTGMGFIGGGAILKEPASVRGTATAASIWMTGVVGAAVGYGRLEVAIPASLVSFFTLYLMRPFRRSSRRRRPPSDRTGG